MSSSDDTTGAAGQLPGAETANAPLPPALDRYAQTLGRGHSLWARIGCEYPGAIWTRVGLLWAMVVLPVMVLSGAIGLISSPLSAIGASALGLFGAVGVLRAVLYRAALRPTQTALKGLTDSQRGALVRQGQRRVEVALSQMPAANPTSRRQWLRRDLSNRLRHGACGLFDDSLQRQLDALVYLRAPASSNTRTLAYDIACTLERAWQVPAPATADPRPQCLRRMDQALDGASRCP